MSRLLGLFVLLLLSIKGFAAELTVLSGWQLNRDFEVSSDYSSLGSSGVSAGEEIDFESGIFYALALDFVYANNPDQRYGFFVSHQQSELGETAELANSDLDVTHAHITFMNYYRYGRWSPFVLAGAGVGIFSPADASLDDENLFSGQLATGANLQLNERLSLHADIRWLVTFFDGQSAIFCDGGCVITVKSDVYSQMQTGLGLQFKF